MSVYQVEEYYIFVKVPEDMVESVDDMLNNHQELGGLDVNWDGNNLTIDNFDCESRANQINSEIQDILED